MKTNALGLTFVIFCSLIAMPLLVQPDPASAIAPFGQAAGATSR